MRVVLVRLSALGDIVHTWPLADAIRASRPDVHLTWIVEEALAPLVDGHPAVDAVLITATKRWRRTPLATRTRAEIAVLKSRLAELAPELTIDAQGTFKSAVVTRWTGAPRRVGLARPWRRELVAGFALNETIPGSSADPHVIATNLELVHAVGGDPAGQTPEPNGRWLLSSAPGHPFQRRQSGAYTVLLPGAGRPEKILGAPVFAEVARHLADRGQAVVVAWGPSEEERAREISDLAGDGVTPAPPTDLLQLTHLLGEASLVIGGDTGPVHLAASLGVPTLGIFLTTDADRNRPIGDCVVVVSGAAPGRGPTGAAATTRRRDVSSNEICDAADRLVDDPRSPR